MSDKHATAQDQVEKKPSAKTTSFGDNATYIIISAIRLFTALVERFGWPGAVLIALGVFTHLWSSEDQKHQIIDMYILGKGMHSWWPLAVPSIFFGLVVWAQYEMNKKKVKELTKEMRRIGAEKSALQERISGRDLQHRRPNEEGEGE